VLAALTAAFGLWYRRLPGRALAASARVVAPPIRLLRGAHSGIAGDYVLWIVAGTAVIGGVWGITLR